MATRNLGPIAALVVTFVSTIVPTVARGDERADAAQHWKNAVGLRDSGDYAGAICELKMAYELAPEPGVLFALGKAYITIDKPVEAVDALERCLATGKSKISPQQRVEAEMALRKQRERIGLLEFRVIPEGAAVSLDGVELGIAPLANKVRTAAGLHTVVVSLAGYAPTTVEVEVAGGKDKPVEVTLKPLPVSKGMLRIQCAVPDARVTANGTTVGSTPFAAPVLLPSGDYRLHIARAGYIDSEHLVTIDVEHPASVDCGLKQLAPLPANVRARLRIVGASRDTRTQVDGEFVPPEVDLPSGRHTIRISKIGYRSWERDVNLIVGKRTDLSPEFAPDGDSPKPHPTRTVSSQRSWALGLGAGGVLLGAGALGVKLWNDGHYVKERDAAARAAQEYNSQTNALVTQQARAWSASELQTESALVSHERDLNRKVVTLNGVAIGLAAGAGVLLCSSAIVWLSGSPENVDAKVAVVPQRDGASFSWSGAF